jgi:hypothetical protein
MTESSNVKEGLVRLTKTDGTTVEFAAAVQSGQAKMLNQMKLTTLEEIRVVQEYPDVFSEDLSGMSSDHDIEFPFELLLGTPPISKRPYRMPVNELVELKKQIAELQAKRFIRNPPQHHRHGGHQCPHIAHAGT